MSSVAKNTEITSRSPESFQHAIEQGIGRFAETVDNVKQAWVKDQSLKCSDDGIEEYQVTMKVTFVLENP